MYKQEYRFNPTAAHLAHDRAVNFFKSINPMPKQFSHKKFDSSGLKFQSQFLHLIPKTLAIPSCKYSLQEILLHLHGNHQKPRKGIRYKYDILFDQSNCINQYSQTIL